MTSSSDSLGQTCDSVRWRCKIFHLWPCANDAAGSCATCRRSSRSCAAHWSRHTSAAVGRTATASMDQGMARSDICPSAEPGGRPRRDYVPNHAHAGRPIDRQFPQAAQDARRDLRDQCGTPATTREILDRPPWTRHSLLSTSPRRAPSSPTWSKSYLAAGAPPFDPEGADDNDFQDCRSTSVATSLHLHPPVDDGASSLQPGEYRAPIQSNEQSRWRSAGSRSGSASSTGISANPARR